MKNRKKEKNEKKMRIQKLTNPKNKKMQQQK